MKITFTGKYIKKIIKKGKKKKIIFVEEPIFQNIGILTMSEGLFYELFGLYDSNSGNQYINALKDFVFSNVEIPYVSIGSFINDIKNIGEKIDDNSLQVEYYNFISFIEIGYKQIRESEINHQDVILEFIGES